MLPLLAIALVAGGGFVVYKVVSSDSSSKPSDPLAALPKKLDRAFPAPDPFVAPNIYMTKYPLCWWANSKDKRPSKFNIAMDVAGRPYTGHSCSTLKGWNTGDKFLPGDDELCSVDNKAYVGPMEGGGFGTWGYPGTWGAEATLGESITNIVVKYVLPIAITVAGTAIGGIGGALAAFAVTALLNISAGARIDAAIVGAYQERLSNEVQRTALGQAYTTVINSSVPYASDKLRQLRDEAVSKVSDFQKEDVAKAFTDGANLANAQRLQQGIIWRLKTIITAEEAGWLDECLKRGAALVDWVTAMYGKPGTDAMNIIAKDVAAKIQAGQSINTVDLSKVARGVLSGLTRA